MILPDAFGPADCLYGCQRLLIDAAVEPFMIPVPAAEVLFHGQEFRLQVLSVEGVIGVIDHARDHGAVPVERHAFLEGLAYGHVALVVAPCRRDGRPFPVGGAVLAPAPDIGRRVRDELACALEMDFGMENGIEFRILIEREVRVEPDVIIQQALTAEELSMGKDRVLLRFFDELPFFRFAVLDIEI